MLSDSMASGIGGTEAPENWNQMDQRDLRDWFAGLALQEILDANEDDLEDGSAAPKKARRWAQMAYTIADMMMQAREGSTSGDYTDEEDEDDDESEEDDSDEEDEDDEAEGESGESGSGRPGQPTGNYDPPYEAPGQDVEPEPDAEGEGQDFRVSQHLRNPDLPEIGKSDDPTGGVDRRGQAGEQGDDDVKGFGDQS